MRNAGDYGSIHAVSEEVDEIVQLNVDGGRYFVYFDPPYHPLSKTACFTDYTTGGFSFEDQKRLANVFRRLSDKGVRLMLSNSSTPEIKELYNGFSIHTVMAKRFINCNGYKRSGASELIITNY